MNRVLAAESTSQAQLVFPSYTAAQLVSGHVCLVSGYSNWYAKRRRRPGHLARGRFKVAQVEDESG